MLFFCYIYIFFFNSDICNTTLQTNSQHFYLPLHFLFLSLYLSLFSRFFPHLPPLILSCLSSPVEKREPAIIAGRLFGGKRSSKKVRLSISAQVREIGSGHKVSWQRNNSPRHRNEKKNENNNLAYECQI